MGDEQYIWIRNWERFQHYATRNPIWIKTYTELLHDSAYLRLTSSRRGLLHGLHLAFALARRCLPLDVEMLNSRLRVAAKMSDLTALNHAGFLTFVDSAGLAECEQAYSKAIASRAPARSRDKEEERDKDKGLKALRSITS